jgi:hypothetical protein
MIRQWEAACERGDTAGAIEVVCRALKDHSEHVGWICAGASAHLQAGDTAAAYQCIRSAVNLLERVPEEQQRSVEAVLAGVRVLHAAVAVADAIDKGAYEQRELILEAGKAARAALDQSAHLKADEVQFLGSVVDIAEATRQSRQ